MCALLAAWWLAYLYPLVTIDDVIGSLMSAQDTTAQGSLYNQALLICWAGFGIVHFPRAVRALQSRQSRTLLMLLALYVSWAVLSISWSEELQLTARRLVALICLLAGGFGLGAGFYGRTRNSIATIARHSIYAAGICVVLLFALRLSQGSLLDLLNPQWTLKYTTSIEAYAFPLVFAIVAATFLYRDRPVYRLVVGGALFLILILLKGRTLIVDVASASGVVYSRITRFRVLRVAALAVSCVLAGLLADLMTGGEYIIRFIVNMSDSIAAWMPYLSIGDGLRNITTLSGRLPLWQALLRYAGQRPYVGYGFGAFWGPSRFAEVFAATQWHAVVAHNGFLDEILATGLVGLALQLTFWFYGMYISLKLRSGGYLVFGWMLLFLFLNVMSSIIQSFFAYPTLVTLIALGAIMDECSGLRCSRCGSRLEPQRTPAGELVLCHA